MRRTVPPTLMQRTSRMELMLGDISAGVQRLQNADWETALLHLDDAHAHPERAADELRHARGLLYRAWNTTSLAGQRALIAQQTSSVCALLGEPEDSHAWLLRSFPMALTAFEDSAAEVAGSLEGMRRVKAGVKTGKAIPAGTLTIHRGTGVERPWKTVSEEPLLAALHDLAQTKFDLFALRGACTLAGMPGPWSTYAAHQVDSRRSRYGKDSISLRPKAFATNFMVYGPPGSLSVPVELLTRIGQWTFAVDGIPGEQNRDAARGGNADAFPKLYVSGSAPELGGWSAERAIPLLAVDARTGSLVVHMPALDTGEEVRYKYFVVTRPGAEATWEPGSSRRLPPPVPDSLRGHPERRVSDTLRLQPVP